MALSLVDDSSFLLNLCILIRRSISMPKIIIRATAVIKSVKRLTAKVEVTNEAVLGMITIKARPVKVVNQKMASVRGSSFFL